MTARGMKRKTDREKEEVNKEIFKYTQYAGCDERVMTQSKYIKNKELSSDLNVQRMAGLFETSHFK